MSRWAQNRRTAIVGGLLLLLALIVFGIYTLFFYQKPSCFDGILNGVEEGIDCGGTCQLVCPFSATEPNILWSRAFEISDGVYNFTGVIENTNFDLRLDAEYKFEAYNAENALIEEIFGEVTIFPTEKKTIFEPTILTGFQDIERLFLKVVGDPVWTKSTQKEQVVFVTSRKLTEEDTAPKLEVTLTNKSVLPVRDLIVTAVLYNAEGNVYQTSRTFLEFIDRDSDAALFYTWPEPFEEDVTKIDIFIDEAPLL